MIRGDLEQMTGLMDIVTRKIHQLEAFYVRAGFGGVFYPLTQVLWGLETSDQVGGMYDVLASGRGGEAIVGLQELG